MAQTSPQTTAPLYGTWSALCMCALFPIYIVPVLVYRWILIWTAKRFRPDLSHCLRPQSTLFLRDSTENEPNMNMVFDFQMESAMEIDKVREVLSSDRFLLAQSEEDVDGHRRLAYPELQQYCAKWGGYFFWKCDAAFKIEHHVRVQKLGALEDVTSFLCKYTTEPLPTCRSPWAMLLLEGEQENSQVHHMLFKYHHSLADPHRMLKTLCHAFELEFPVNSFHQKDKGPDAPDGLNGMRLLSRLRHTFHLVREFIVFVTAKSQRMPWTNIPPQTLSETKRQHICAAGEGQEISIEQLELIANQHGVSPNAVVYAALAGGLRSSLLANYGADEIPEVVRFPYAMPIGKRFDQLCNSLVAVTLSLPVGESEPRERIRACERMLRCSQQSLEKRVSFFVVQVLSLLPYTFPFQLRVNAGSVCLSALQIIGPPKSVTMAGVRVQRMTLPGIVKPLSFFVAFVSYNGRLQWTCNGDTRIFSQTDLAHIGRSIREEIEGFEKIGDIDFTEMNDVNRHELPFRV